MVNEITLEWKLLIPPKDCHYCRQELFSGWEISVLRKETGRVVCLNCLSTAKALARVDRGTKGAEVFVAKESRPAE